MSDNAFGKQNNGSFYSNARWKTRCGLGVRDKSSRLHSVARNICI